MKLLITTDRQPWLDGAQLERGAEVEIEDADLAKSFLDNDFAVELVVEDEPAGQCGADTVVAEGADTVVAAEPAAKGKKNG